MDGRTDGLWCISVIGHDSSMKGMDCRYMCFRVVGGVSEKATLKGCVLCDCVCVTCKKTSLVMEEQAVAA